MYYKKYPNLMYKDNLDSGDKIIQKDSMDPVKSLPLDGVYQWRVYQDHFKKKIRWSCIFEDSV